MDTIKTIESQQTFAKSVYLDFMSKRFGITQKGITDLSSAIVQKYLCDWQNNEKKIPAIIDVSYDTYTPEDTSDPCSGIGVPTWCILCADGNCNDEECLIVNVIDSAGNPVKNFEIYIDGFNSGFTDEDGEFLYTFEKASIETQHTIQVCYCFETVGNCRQQKITIVVEADECAEECKPLTPCIEIKKKIIDEFTSGIAVYFNDVLRYTQQCNVDLKFTIKNESGDLIDATFNGYDIIISQLCPDGTVLNSSGTYNKTVASGGTLGLPDITVSNSDDSYSVSVPSVQDVELPDENITLNGVSFITKPSIKDQDILLKNESGVKITPEALSGNTITIKDEIVCETKGLMPLNSGQTTSYATNDDGDLQRGRLVDYSTLPYNNGFGTTDRFTDELGGQTFTNNIIIDWSTWDGGTDVNGYILSLNSDSNNTVQNWGTWMAGQPYTTDGFGDWYVVNVSELNTLMNYELSSTLDGYPFNNPTSSNGRFWTSTTSPSNSNVALLKERNSYLIANANKINFDYHTMWVRTFTWNGASLT